MPASPIASALFNGLFRRNYVFLSTVFLGAFAFEIAFDSSTDAIWNRLNRGRQWRDIKQKYMQPAEGEDEDDE